MKTKEKLTLKEFLDCTPYDLNVYNKRADEEMQKIDTKQDFIDLIEDICVKRQDRDLEDEDIDKKLEQENTKWTFMMESLLWFLFYKYEKKIVERRSNKITSAIEDIKYELKQLINKEEDEEELITTVNVFYNDFDMFNMF